MKKNLLRDVPSSTKHTLNKIITDVCLVLLIYYDFSSFSFIETKTFSPSSLIPLVCARRSSMVTASRGVNWKGSCSSFPSSLSCASSSSSLYSSAHSLFMYSLPHYWTDLVLQSTISEMIGGWKLDNSSSKSTYSAAAISFSISFVSVSSFKSSTNSSYKSACYTMPHF